MIRGQTIYYNDGELAFDMAINTKKDVGTHRGVFLEEMPDHDACGNKYSKILTENDKIAVVQNSLISLFNI
jgi:hypothetical protein